MQGEFGSYEDSIKKRPGHLKLEIETLLLTELSVYPEVQFIFGFEQCRTSSLLYANGGVHNPLSLLSSCAYMCMCV